MNGIELFAVISELNKSISGASVSRVDQPFPDTLLLTFHMKGCHRRLIVSINPRLPRVHLTEASFSNPPQPPVFCQLLRSRLEGKKLGRIAQPGLERVLWLPFSHPRPQGDAVPPEASYHLVIELMGKHSNVILLDGEKRIVDAMKRITRALSRVREVVPGVEYANPPAQDKLDARTMTRDEFKDRMLREAAGSAPTAALLKAIQGVDPELARDLVAATGLATEKTVLLTESQVESLWHYLVMMRQRLQTESFDPILVEKPDKTVKPIIFGFLAPQATHAEPCVTSKFPTVNSLMDAFYTALYDRERLETGRARLKRLVSDIIERISSKLAKQQDELRASEESEKFKRYGDILLTHANEIPPRAESVELPDWEGVEEDADTGEGLPEKRVRIPLDPLLSPAESAQRYFRIYKRLRSARTHVEREIRKSRRELEYLDKIVSMVEMAAEPKDLEAIEEELSSEGYIRERKGSAGTRRGKTPGTRGSGKALHDDVIRFSSSEGIEILVGRNNLQNEYLTLHVSNPEDTWLHAKGQAGAHVILKTSQAKGGPRSLMEAATIAAYYSRSRMSSNVPVDYTLVKYVKKPKGSKPGMVIYDHHSTLFVTPRQEFVNALRTQ